MPKLLIDGKEYSPKLILFDVDGTLIDDMHRYSSLGKARYYAFKKAASVKAAEEWARLSGVNTRDWSIDPLGPISKAPRRDDLVLAAEALYLDGYNWYEARALAETLYANADEEQKKDYKPKLFYGTLEKLMELKDAGFTLGIATNGVTKLTEDLIEMLGIKDLFSVVVGADLVENSKPAPDMLLKACEIVGHRGTDCMYVGDQPTDMEAANEAKTISLGVRSYELAAKGARETLTSVKDIIVISKS